MTTYIIYADPNDGYLQSTDTVYANAQNGSNLTVDNTGDYVRTGLNYLGSTKYVYQGFFSFDTTVIAGTEHIIDATLSMYQGYSKNQDAVWGTRFLNYNWAAPLTTASWRTQAQLKALPQAAVIDYMFASVPFQWRSTGADSLINNISKTAPTKFVAASSMVVDGANYSTGVMEMWTNSGSTTNKPYLTVYTTAADTLNGITEASTTLTDGTTISIRSDAASAPTMTLGYTALNGAWTAISTLGSDFIKNIDGPGALDITSDPAGNIFVLGMKSGYTSFVAGQAFTRQTATTWTAQNAIWQPIPSGNESSVRAISATYIKGGLDGKDLPEIYLMTVRGSAGNHAGYQYHVPGAGWAQDHHVLPNVLLAGTGAMLRKTNSAYAPHNATGVPASADVISLDNNMVAVYVARGKFGNTTVGGVSTIKIYGQDGYTQYNDSNYLPTGSAQLVAISPTVFAHVFDNGGANLTVRFYNVQCQILGEVSLSSSSFYGGKIGNQFAAYYDKTANLVRVYFVDSSASNAQSRWDVSPTTYSGSFNTSTVSVGAAGSINTDLRISRTSDERYVLIESANNASGVLSTVSYYSTAGNVVPMAPSLTTRANFDATSAATFTWKPGDANPADYQTGFDFEVSRVSDSVVVYAPAKVVSTVSSMTVPASTLVNATNYRWRVRTYDVLGAAGTWSNYGTFTTAATGTLTITAPSSDNLTGIDTSSYTVTWSYVQSAGQTQTQRQVRLIRTSDSAVLLDTTMQVDATSSYTVTGMESGKEYRIEVSLINSASVSVPVVSRLITPDYSQPMTPTFNVNIKNSYMEIVIANPLPTGNRPEVVFNDIYKRKTSVTSLDADFKRIAIVSNSATYLDYAVKSGVSYDYRIISRTS